MKRVRLQQNISQTELAKMTQSSLSTVRRFEATGQGSVAFFVQALIALRSVDALEELFAQGAETIEQVEQAQEIKQRRRARSRNSAQRPEST